MHQNTSLGLNGVDWVLSLRKIPTRLHGTNFCTSSARYPPRSMATKQSWMHTNGTKCMETLVLGQMGVDRVHSLRKILTQLGGTNFCTSSARFAPSFVRQPNGPEYTQMVRNALKCHFRVQWSGSCAFVAKNPDANSWHEHLH